MNLLNIILLSITSQGGWTVAIVGFLVVFIVLTLLVLIFNNIPKLINLKRKKNIKKSEAQGEIIENKLSISGEVNAAISMAIYLYINELHDEESNIITIKRVPKAYIPWSSKIFSIRNYPKR